MTIPVGSGRTARPSVVRLTSADFSAIPAGATDGQLVTLAEAKRFVNVEHDEDDSLLTSLIHSAESEVETRLQRDLRQRNYRAVFSTCDVIAGTLFYTTSRAAAAVESVYMWRDGSDDENELGEWDGSTGDFRILAGPDGEKIIAISDAVLETYGQGNDAGDFMMIDFETANATSANLFGYHEIKRAVMHIVAGGYEAREEVAQGAGFSENPAIERLLRSHVKHLSLSVL